MPKVCRMGDIGGGPVVSIPQSTVYLNNRLVCVLHSGIAGHGKSPHSGPVVAQSEPSVVIENIPVTHIGHAVSCGHTMSTGSPDMIIGEDS